MLTAKIKLKTIEDVKDFVNLMSKLDYDVDLYSERYIINAKSIMGVFSLDLSKELNLKAHTTSVDEMHNISEILEPYKVK